MCNGFGLIVTKGLDCYFIEPSLNSGNCSHSTILERLGWQDNTSPFRRDFVRVQYPDNTPDSFEFDEDSTLPAWVEENRQEIKDKCGLILERYVPALAEYLKVCDAAWAEYEKGRAPAWAEYQRVRDPAYAEYQQVRDPALAELVNQISAIPGYVKG